MLLVPSNQRDPAIPKSPTVATRIGEPSLIKRDLHVHLYGCLSAEDLWLFGKDRYKKHQTSLSWYAQEYAKAWGRTPQFQEYWKSDSGLDLLKADYIFAKPNNFARFQANFNLIIALCSITPDSFDIQEKIIKQVNQHGLEYFEARTVIPIKLQDHKVYKYLQGLCKVVKTLNTELPMQTRIVFSLFRDNTLASKAYRQLREFMKSHPELSSVISGIDFAFAEEGSPPKSKKALFQQFKCDNQNDRPLDLLYHVGESFEDKGIISAIRWVWEADQLGASRLGHAIALGVNPENYKEKMVHEAVEERIDTIRWLIEHEEVLKEHGYQPNIKRLKRELNTLKETKQKTVTITYNDDYIEDAKCLQRAVIRILKTKNATIETCPTSNLRIGQVSSPIYHPLKLFQQMGLNCVTCTDDPGIFAIDWVSEHRLAQKIINMDLANCTE